MKKSVITIIGSSVLVAILVFTNSGFAKADDGEVHNGTIHID